jgi:hypothetical protein
MFTLGWCLLVYNLSTRPDLSSDPEFGVPCLIQPLSFEGLLSRKSFWFKETILAQAIADCLGQHKFEVDAVSNRELAVWKLFDERTHLDLLI